MIAGDVRRELVEGNLLALFRTLVGNPAFTVHDEPDVLWVTSASDCPIFNGALGARFSPEHAADGARRVLDQLVRHGQAFLWWATPSTRSPELVEALTAYGLVTSTQEPGMHARLDDPTIAARVDGPPTDPSVLVRPADDAAALRSAVDVMVEGFGLPDGWRAVLGAALGTDPRSPQPETTVVAAYLDGRPVGAGSVTTVDGVAGLYNITVLPPARRRGVGTAITVGLMRVARELGARHCVLFASEMGYATYRRLGFEDVCALEQYAWLPA